MSVSQLETFIKSTVQLHQSDKQVADALKNFKLTERLDARKVEDLQGLGAGPRTLEVLREWSEASKGLPTPAPPVVTAIAPPIPPPSAAEQAAILAEVRQNALDYTSGLPDYICTQRTRRYVDPGRGGWRIADVIQEQLSYVDHHENYKVTLVNNLPVSNVSHEQLGGTTSSGEFATMLYQIFKPETQTRFEWGHWATLRDRRTYTYEFTVLQRNSEYTVHDEPSGRTGVFGYHGLVYADTETKRVMRIKMTLDGLENFPIKEVSLDLNYDFTEISGNEFVLPLRAEISSRYEDGYQSRNDIEFRLYQKFTSDASISFDIPDDLPPEDFEEQPAQPDNKP